MKLDGEDVRVLVSLSLVSLMIVIPLDLWFIDLLTMQRTFALLLASELVAFSMLAHVYSKASYSQVSKSWLLAGCVALALFLFLTLL